MIRLVVICFTEKGMTLCHNIKRLLDKDAYSVELFAKYESFSKAENSNVIFVEEGLSQWAYDRQQEKTVLVFIGAMGIAVRAIAKGIENKLTDAPVVVIDELGINVIPVVGGHVGGANELAINIAKAINANPVITTATDINGCFSVDLFAKENNLAIHNKDGIAKVSAKALEGKAIRISIENYPPKSADVVISSDRNIRGYDILLCPKKYAVGIGCRKDTEFDLLKELFLKVLRDNDVNVNDVGAIASIDLKVEEECITKLSEYYRIPFITYTAELLSKAEGVFSESAFVKEKTGVGNVCERAAMLLTGNRGKIIQSKYSENGMTIAIAKME